jgi:hypothetical protein
VLINGIIDQAGVAWGADPDWLEAGTIEAVLRQLWEAERR